MVSGLVYINTFIALQNVQTACIQNYWITEYFTKSKSTSYSIHTGLIYYGEGEMYSNCSHISYEIDIIL